MFCMLAQHNAGLSDLTPGAAINENILNVPLLRSQVSHFILLRLPRGQIPCYSLCAPLWIFLNLPIDRNNLISKCVLKIFVKVSVSSIL